MSDLMAEKTCNSDKKEEIGLGSVFFRNVLIFKSDSELCFFSLLKLDCPIKLFNQSIYKLQTKSTGIFKIDVFWEASPTIRINKCKSIVFGWFFFTGITV
ncbi:MAG: hypothetical protein QUS12_13590 [Methanosarcina sp.]|nr:hypothetical protein [Methanosarcina sp.]